MVMKLYFVTKFLIRGYRIVIRIFKNVNIIGGN